MVSGHGGSDAASPPRAAGPAAASLGCACPSRLRPHFTRLHPGESLAAPHPGISSGCPRAHKAVGPPLRTSRVLRAAPALGPLLVSRA